MRISSRLRTVHWALACVWIVAGWQGAAALPQGPDDIDRAAVLQAFTERTERYVRLRARLEEPLPSFDARRDPWSLMLTRRYLASAIRTARSNAHQGDIFTRPVAEMFRDVIAQAIYDVDIEGLVDGDIEADGFIVDLAVNEPIPAWAMDAVPRALLHRLPSLPAAIEYRIVSGTLILWDVHAEILIDALPGAFFVEVE
jgi:hypothetical protein